MVSSVSDSIFQDIKDKIKSKDLDSKESCQEISEMINEMLDSLSLTSRVDRKRIKSKIYNIEQKLLEKFNLKIHVDDYHEKHRLEFSPQNEIAKARKDLLDEVNDNLKLL
ncbi:MAG: hypothetical protein WD335_01690 [Candidatus Paceibacterota bacterium]